jgi:signal transduction histidine kinase
VATPPEPKLNGGTTASTKEDVPQPSDLGGPDLGGLVRPLLEALATFADLESTYLTVFDWERHEQEVRFVFNAGEPQVVEGHRIPLPAELSPEAFPGVTRSPQTIGRSQPDSWVAQRLGLKTYVSVPVTVGKHQLFGMLCGASRQPRALSETVVSMFESLAAIIGKHVVRLHTEATEERATAAETQLLSRSRFIAEAEHRLKTPLTVLHGMSLTLRAHQSDLSESARIALNESMIRHVDLLSQEVERLLVEARAEVRIRELSPVDLELGPLVRELAGAFDGLGTAHDVVADVSEEVAAYVDPTAIYQVMGHLLDNAIKYSPNGGRITIRLSRAAGSVAIDVIDEGIGLPSDTDIFEAFSRADPQDGQTPGIGLGLHIVRDLVEAMMGTVTARRNPEGGSTFNVSVPSARRPGESAQPVDRPDAIITLVYYDADGNMVDSEDLRVSPDAGSVWIKPSQTILSWPAVRTVRASLTRTPKTPVDIDVHLLPPTCVHPSTDTETGRPDRF